MPHDARDHAPLEPGQGGAPGLACLLAAVACGVVTGACGGGGGDGSESAKRAHSSPRSYASHREPVLGDAPGRVRSPGPSTIGKPGIVRWPIPFPRSRKAEMAAYARRHYGLRTYRLRRPKVIALHYSETRTAGAVYETFAPDRPDPELHELPGVCAHFVVDRDGAIYQLVSLSLMCRHVVGLNHVAIGIEHVAEADREALSNRRQLASSLRLTRWLRCRYRIALRDVIGHAESLSSPYHYERVARLRAQTHSDMGRRTMRRYRRLLAARARRCPPPKGPSR